MIKNVPRNYSNDLDRRRQGLDSITENLLPDVETTDAGKIMKVGEDGKWHLGSDENTIIEANPEEGSASEELENLKIGNTIYSVNKPTFDTIKGLRITISDGGEYRTDKPKIEFYDDAGNLMTYPAYTSSCDKEYAGNISLNQVCSIATGDAPGAFTYVFSDDVVVTTYHLIKLTNAGSFAGDIAKNVKIELSSDGENFITLWEDPSISWSGTSGASRILDIKTGELSDTILPIVTSADNGKVLGVVGGVWDKMSLTSSPIITMTKRSGAGTFEFNDGYKLNDIKNLLLSGVFPVFIYEENNTKQIFDVLDYNITNSPSLILQRFDRSTTTSTLITRIGFNNGSTGIGYFTEYTVNDPT